MTLLVSDTFTDSAGRPITAHTPERGEAVVAVAAFTAALAITAGGRMRASPAGSNVVRYLRRMGPDQVLRARLVIVTLDAGSHRDALAARIQPDGSRYVAGYNVDRWRIFAPGYSGVGTVTVEPLVDGATYDLLFSLTGPALTLEVSTDGGATWALKAAANSSAITKGGRVGFDLYNEAAYTDSAGHQWDDFTADGTPEQSETLGVVDSSYGTGTGASAGNDYPTVLKGLLAKEAVENRSVGATCAPDQYDQVLLLRVAPDSVTVWGTPGLNDYRNNGTDAAKLEDFVGCSRAILVVLLVPRSRFAFAGTAAVAESGAGWSSAGVLGGVRFTQSEGAYAEAVRSGRTIYVCLMRAAGHGGLAEISVDGAVVLSGVDTDSSTSTTAAPPRTYLPYCVRIGGLSDGEHVVRVTNANGGYVTVVWIVGVDGSDLGPRVTAALAHRIPGYGVAPSNGSDAAADLYRSAQSALYTELGGDGLELSVADVMPGQDQGTDFDPDLVHENDLGHAKRAAALASPTSLAVHDSVAPAAPAGGSAAVAAATVTVTHTWTPGVDETTGPADCVHRLYRDGVLLGTGTYSGGTVTYVETVAADESEHDYHATTVDAAGNESDPSAEWSATYAAAGGGTVFGPGVFGPRQLG